MSGSNFCPDPNCRMELEPYAEKCSLSDQRQKSEVLEKRNRQYLER